MWSFLLTIYKFQSRLRSLASSLGGPHCSKTGREGSNEAHREHISAYYWSLAFAAGGRLRSSIQAQYKGSTVESTSESKLKKIS